MGNQLSSIAPSQILSVDHYFSDLRDYEYDISLGSTRFFKVARAKHREGFCVVKVFAIQDPSLPLQTYHKHIKEISDKLQSIPSILPFEKIIVTEKAGILVRQYIKDNLYDRISTRPFLNLLEKKWIVFQLLCALVHCHENQVCHGDIKTENIMVTSWTSVLLTDIASFKPTYLQEDNPADFSYFFDTSRRRTCYLAPERFLDSRTSDLVAISSTTDQGEPSLDLDLIKDHVSELTSKMDIFSVGCVIAELFSEGSPLFDLSKLLAYRSGDYDPSPALEKIDDKHIRELITEMISKNPEERGEAAEYLDKYRGCLFPEEFYTFLRVFMVRFASLPALTPDEKIADIADCISVILNELTKEKNEKEDKQHGSLVLIISLVTSSVRSCIYCDSKLKCLDLLLQLAQNSRDEIILERVVPYILYLIGDSVPRVRAQALWTLTQTLQLVQMLPQNEGNIFPEYILPALANFPDDEEVIVRIAYAENIAPIAETALKFLEMAQLRYNSMDMEDGEVQQNLQYQGSYDVELQGLHEVIQSKVVNLLSDSENIVKQTLLEKGITRLCVFFGRQKANDVLLSHMITFLNDKQDWHLRAAFFDSIVGVASYVGWQSLAMLKPLLQMGLTDTEEFVICKALNALTCLTELGLLQKSTLYDFTAEIVVFLCHPNIWIRYGAVGFVTAVARSLSVVDIHCKLLPLLRPFVKEKIVQADQDMLLISVLKEPVLRSVFDFVVRSLLINDFFDSLRDRQVIRHLNKQGQKAEYPKLENDGLSHMFRKLIVQGMNDGQEDMLIHLKTVIMKIHYSKATASDKGDLIEDRSRPGVIDLKRFGNTIVRRHADLVVKTDQKSDNATTQAKNVKKTKREYQSPLNAEWNQIFGNVNQAANSQTLPPQPRQQQQQQKQQKELPQQKEQPQQQQQQQQQQPPPPQLQQQQQQQQQLQQQQQQQQQQKQQQHEQQQEQQHEQQQEHLRPQEQEKKQLQSQQLKEEQQQQQKQKQQQQPQPDVVFPKKQSLTRSASMPQPSKTKLRSNSTPSNDYTSSRPSPPPAQPKNGPQQTTQSSQPERPGPGYKRNLRDLVKHKREQYAEELKTRDLIEEFLNTNKTGQIRRPKGTLVIHLHEHRASVNKLCVCPNTSLFASASNDGTMKLWDTQRVEKQGMVVKSCFTFQLQQGNTATRGKVKGLAFLQGEHTIACATDKGDIYIINPERVPNTSALQCPHYKAQIKLDTKLDTVQGGDLVDMHQFDTASHSVLSYATVRGLIYGWDIRASKTIWKLQNDPALGLITSFVVDPSQYWLTAGTCNGELVCWDMRFQLPVGRLTHPRGARVRRLSAAPLLQCKPSWVTCSVDGNNEVSVWNLETGACEKSLWASHAPPLSQTQVSPHAVYGVYTSPPDVGQFILTAGSDRRIRLWDLQSPKDSCIVAGSSSDNLNDVVLNYNSRLIDGTEVVREIYCKSNQVMTQDDVPKRGPDKPPTGHHDCITDLAFVTNPQHFLISAARDGVIKIWK